MLQGVIPQAVIVLSHGITFGATGMMAVFNQTDSDTCGFRAHLRTIAVHAVEQMPFIVNVSIRGHKRAAIAERVKGPDTTVVLVTEAVHPGENAGFQRYPLWDRAKVLRPEADTLFVGYLRYGQFKFSDSLAADARLFFVAIVMGMSPSIKKRQRRRLAYAVIMSVRED